MRNLLAKREAWIERRERKHLEWWKQKRTQGKMNYVLWATFTWGGLMTAIMSLLDYFDGRLRFQTLPFKIPLFLISGYILGLFIWWDNERKYQNSLKSNSGINPHVKE